MFTQIEGVLVTFIYSGLLTYGILKVTEKFIGFRVSEEDEVMGLDLSQHDEVGYNL